MLERIPGGIALWLTAVVFVSFALVGAVFAGDGVADTRTVTDPVDSALALDPVSATHGHSGKRLLVHTLRANEAWDGANLYRLEIAIWLTRRARRPDRTVVVEQPTSQTFDPKVTVRNLRNRIIGKGRASRPDERSVRVQFRKGLLGKHTPGAYHWAMTLTSACKMPPNGYLCGGPKRDRVPDRGRVIHRLHR